jgi:hypothetical protein
VHASAELFPTARAEGLVLLIGVPFSSRLSLELSLPVALSFRVHDAAVLELLAALGRCDFFTFQEGGLICFGTRMRSSYLGGVLSGRGNAARQFLLCEFWLLDPSGGAPIATNSGYPRSLRPGGRLVCGSL